MYPIPVIDPVGRTEENLKKDIVRCKLAVTSRVGIIVHLYNLTMHNINLPEFSEKEKIAVTNALNGTFIDDFMLPCIPHEVVEHNGLYHELEPDEEKLLFEKLSKLDNLQRIKLVDMCKIRG